MTDSRRSLFLGFLMDTVFSLAAWLPPLAFERPVFLWLFAGLPLLWLVQRRSLRSGLGRLSLGLHSLLVGVLILIAAGCHSLRPGTVRGPLLAFDVSHSLTPDQRRWMRDTAVRRLAPGPDTPSLLFAGTRQWLPWSEAEPLLLDPPLRLQLEHSNLAGALTDILAAQPGRTTYVLSDGWETVGSAAPLLPLLAERRQRLYPLAPPGAERLPNLAVQRIGAPQVVQKGDGLTLRLVLDNTHPGPVAAELVLHQRNEPVWQGVVSLSPGVSVLTRSVSLSGDGLIPLRATLTPASDVQDARPDDNQAVAWVRVSRPDTVLLLSGRDRDSRYLRQALSSRGFEVRAPRVSSSSTIPAPESFGTVILNNVDKHSLPSALPSRLRTYVRDGGGLIMVGGESSLGLGGYVGTPVEQALPVVLTPPQKEEKRTAVMLVIDKSGSMRREQRLLFALAGVRGVARNLKDSDLFGVIGFDREPFPVIPLSYMGKIRHEVEARIDRLRAAGGTYLLPALEEAKRQLERQHATRKHVVILTDGETGGSGSAYLDLVSVMRQELGMTISTIAVGRRPNLRLLSRLADYGGGAFHHTTDPSTLPELFIGELEDTAEEKTMVEQEFTPIPNPRSPLLTGLAARRLPQVTGYVEARLKPGARSDASLQVNKMNDDNQLIGKRSSSTSDTAPPLLASWAYGQGRAVAFTSDANGRWSAAWIGWDGFSSFWEQVVRWSGHTRREKQTDFAVELGHTKQGLVIDLFSHASQEHGRSASADLHLPGGTSHSLSLDRLAPGHYQAVYANPQPGDYRVELDLPSGDTLGPLGYTLPAPNPAGEVPQPEPNLALLESLAHTTGGSLNPDPDSVVHTPGPPQARPLLPYLLPLAVGLYLLELVIRRLAGEPSEQEA